MVTEDAQKLAGQLLNNEKRLVEMFYNLHRDPMLLSVFQQYGIEVFRKSSVLDGFNQFLIATNFHGKRCLEIGAGCGLTACVLSQHFDEVVSIDVVFNPIRYEIAKFLKRDKVYFVTAGGNKDKAEKIADLTFDAAYIDGDHAHDTETDFALVKRCGNILIHEYWPAQPPVWNLINRLRTAGDHVEAAGKFACWRPR